MKIRAMIFLAAAALLLSACPEPKPFDAGGDCPKLPNCGQCTSRGGCGWCDDKCLAIGSPACTGAWVKTMDLCAPLPATPAASATSSH